MKNIFFKIIFAVFIIGFAIFSFSDYKNFHSENKVISREEVITGEFKNLENTEFFYTPYPKLLDDFVNKINKAEKNVYIEVYMFTEKRILQALKDAKSRGVEVKVVLEKKPYMTENANNNHFKELQDAGISVVRSNIENYYYNHSKFFLIDDLAIISTGNLTYSSFTVNRDFFVFTYDKEIWQTLKNIFLADFAGEKKDFYHDNLISSPKARKTLYDFLNKAEKNIKIYAQYSQDKDLNQLFLSLKKQKNIDIEMIIDEVDTENEEIKKLLEAGIKIKDFVNEKNHSKAILIDEKYLFIGSMNFSNYSIEENREIGIFLNDNENIKKFLEIFEKDFN